MKVRRYSLSKRESREILLRAAELAPKILEVIPRKKISLQVMETEGERRWRVFLFEGRPVLVETPDGDLVPFIGLIREVPDLLPRVVVDLGAVRYIANGADVMGPGIVSVEEVEEGSLVAVVDEKYGAPIAVGRALRPASEFKERGKSVENLHHAGDKAYTLVREFLLSKS